MGGLKIRKDFGDGTRRICMVDCRDLLTLFENGTIQWPQITDSDIDDRTQDDKLVKAIAMVQMVWFLAQILGRTTEGLSITTLELFTVGNAVCATITYLAWWSKPNGIRAPILIEGVAPSWVSSCDRFSFRFVNRQRKSALVSLFVGSSFGALHLVAWNFYFVSTTERTLWRISSIGVTVLSAIFPINGLFFDNLTRTYEFIDRQKLSPSLYEYLDRMMGIIGNFLIGLYGLFRIYMLVEMFMALRNVPVNVYKTVQWSQYFPSLG
jgi:hypothetical protein